MKLRCQPEDFQVTELTAVQPSAGPFCLYRLTKTSLGTPEAIQAVCTRWNVHRKRLSYGGLKDRHAVTVQHLTIHNGPRQSMQQKSLQVEYLGQVPAPFAAADISANRFRLVLRDMSQTEIQLAESGCAATRLSGLPNYFDDQRFGSLGASGEWIARAWCLGDWERALWLALADHHPDDPSAERVEKQILRDNWGRWPECQQALAKSHRRSIVTYLSDKIKAGKPADFRGALARINIDLRGLYLSAWQSALWNRLLSRYLQTILPADHLVSYDLRSGPAMFPAALLTAEQLAAITTALPLPSARIDPPEGLVGELLNQVLQAEQVELRQIRVKYPRDSFFSKGSRSSLIFPDQLTSAAANDELYPGHQSLTLSFSLPRGSYATILVKRLTGL